MYCKLTEKKLYFFILFSLKNDLTGEHSCIMLKTMHEADTEGAVAEPWLMAFWKGNTM